LVALPVVSLRQPAPGLSFPLSGPPLHTIAPIHPDRCVLLIPLHLDREHLSADVQQPILIDSDQLRGVQLCSGREQALQWVRPEQLVRLRKSA
jgi:hypothetical protein